MDKERPYTRPLGQLRSVGLRPTRQRLALAKLLFEGTNRHISAEMLHGEALEARVPISLATVYNTLHQFTRVGLLREIIVDSSCSYFDTNTSNHHHFYCEDTRELTDIDGCDIQFGQLPKPPASKKISGVHVVVWIKSN